MERFQEWSSFASCMSLIEFYLSLLDSLPGPKLRNCSKPFWISVLYIIFSGSSSLPNRNHKDFFSASQLFNNHNDCLHWNHDIASPSMKLWAKLSLSSSSSVKSSRTKNFSNHEIHDRKSAPVKIGIPTHSVAIDSDPDATWFFDPLTVGFKTSHERRNQLKHHRDSQDPNSPSPKRSNGSPHQLIEFYLSILL